MNFRLDGWSGENCEIESPCNRVNCGNGYCQESGVEFTCQCDEFYFGEMCENRDSCAAGDYCLNGGECEYDELDAPVCICGVGFEGAKCETEVDVELLEEENDTFDNIVQQGKSTRY